MPGGNNYAGSALHPQGTSSLDPGLRKKKIREGLTGDNESVILMETCGKSIKIMKRIKGDDEKEIRDALNQEKYTMIIADPFLKAVFQKEENRQFLPFAQYAVSSKLGEAASVCVTQGRFNQWFEKRRMK